MRFLGYMTYRGTKTLYANENPKRNRMKKSLEDRIASRFDGYDVGATYPQPHEAT